MRLPRHQVGVDWAPIVSITYPQNEGSIEALPLPNDAFWEGFDASKVRFLPVPERLHIKKAVTALTEERGLKINDVLDHFNINRITYFDHVEPLQDPEPKDEPQTVRVEKRKFSNLKQYSPAEQLQIYERVEKLIRGKHQPSVACRMVGIYESQFRALKEKEAELRALAERETGTSSAPRVIQRKEVDTDAMKKRAFDAATLLCQATRKRMLEISSLVGFPDQKMREWKKETEIEPVFPVSLSRRPLTPAEMRISVEKKIRVVRALDYIEHLQLGDRREIASALGYKEGTVEHWTEVSGVIRIVAKKKRREMSFLLEPREMSDIEKKTGEEREDLQKWVRGFGLRDLLHQLSTKYTKRSSDDQALIDSWKRIWDADGNTDVAMSELLDYYEPFVVGLAKKEKQHLPESVSLDTLVTAGMKGLHDVIKGYDPNHKTRFENFAPLRITGEMKDGLRKDDWVPRSVRQWRKKITAARESFDRIHKRKPEDHELAEALGVSLPYVRELLTTTAPRKYLSIDQDADDNGNSFTELIGSGEEETREFRLRDEDRGGVVQALLNGLSHNERRIIEAYYLEECTMKDIGEELGLSESRISQMHTELLVFLKTKIMAHSGRRDTLGFLASIAPGNGEGEEDVLSA